MPTVAQKTWTDKYPDTLSVSLFTNHETESSAVVFSGNAVWMNPKQCREIAVWVLELANQLENLDGN